MSKPAVIMLVEDNRMDMELTLDAFRLVRLDNPIQVVTNGQDALDYLFRRAKYADRDAYPMPDLILLDLKLPGIDGIEVLRQAKSTPIIKRIPVIILTSSKEEADRTLCYDNGANSYLVKPVSFEDFISMVQQIESYWLSLNVSPPEDLL